MPNLHTNQLADIEHSFHIELTIDSDRITILEDISKSIGTEEMSKIVKKALLSNLQEEMKNKDKI